jgi:hypothetical protein
MRHYLSVAFMAKHVQDAVAAQQATIVMPASKLHEFSLPMLIVGHREPRSFSGLQQT